MSKIKSTSDANAGEVKTQEPTVPVETKNESAATPAPKEYPLDQVCMTVNEGQGGRSVPNMILGLALYVREKWGVPIALTCAICHIETQYGQRVNGLYNWFNLKPHANEEKANEMGYSIFPSLKDSFDRFGHRVTKGAGFKDISYGDLNKYAAPFAKAWFGDANRADDIIEYIHKNF